MSTETEVKSEVEAVVAKVETVAEAVVAEVKADVKKATVEITTEEKLFLRETELEYLKAQMEMQRLTKITEGKSKDYQAYIESLLKKYVISKTEFMFDATINAFKKL